MVNKSSVELSDDEMNLLNKGLNFALAPTSQILKNIIVDTEMAIIRSDEVEKEQIRGAVKNCLKHTKLEGDSENQFNTLKTLNKKDIYIAKADKSNNVIILNKSDYDNAVQTLIDDGPYVEESNPLNKMIATLKKAVKNYIELFGVSWKQKVQPSNSYVPRIYALFKLHKPGNKMRPISSNIGSPFHPMSKWLLKQFSNIGYTDEFSIKNSIELVQKLENVSIDDDEVLISFDIESYFPSVPLDEALEALTEWLDQKPVWNVRRSYN